MNKNRKNTASIETYQQKHGALRLRDEANKACVDQVERDFVSPDKKLNFSP